MHKPTIYEALAMKLGRTPSHAEIKADVKRILEETLIERAERGELAHQRRRCMQRALTIQERRLITRALLHLSTEYAAAAMSREQMGDGRSARMRILRQSAQAQELAWLIEASTAIDVTVEQSHTTRNVAT